MKFVAKLVVVVSMVASALCTYPVRIVAQTVVRGVSQRQTDSIATHILKDPALIASCWLLERDPTHPEGPGRWLKVPRGELGNSSSSDRPIRGVAEGIVTDRALPVIRGGDQLLIEEDSKLVEMRLQAVALQSAGPGEVFAVRLRSTGMVIRAVALAPGRAEIAQGSGVQP